MKKMNKKGFTIVELVIVIAVIAILASVLIPTFSGIIEKAKASNALSTAKNAYTSLLIADDDADISVADKVDYYVLIDGYYFSIDDGKLEDLGKTDPAGVTLNETSTNDEDYEKITNPTDVDDDVKIYKYTAAVATP
ncbi:MAG: type II secretion system protein [Lachnospiraceae bacterium]|nr:type II secretion system protein [Lachnospiraceae bacterium]